MTTWTTIPTASLEPGAPARSVDALALRDNPIAIAEGASGAPKVRTPALQPPAGGGTYKLLRLVGAIEVATSNTTYLSPEIHRGAVYVDAHIPFVVLVPGVVSVWLEHRASGALGATSYARVVKNGVVVTEWSTTSTTMVARAVDVSAAVGDVIAVHQRTSDGSWASYWTNVYVGSANPDFAVA
jgi:hypothetical protein